MKRILIAASILALAAVEGSAYFSGYEGYFTKDSDNLFTQQHAFSINKEVGKASTLGLQLGLAEYNDPSRNEDTQSYQLKFTSKKYEQWEFAAQAGLLHYLQTSMPVFDGNAVYAAPGGFRIEMTLDKDIVGTFAALDNDISVTTLFAGADIPVSKSFTAVAGADSRNFSDGNQRAGFLAKWLYFPPVEGLSLQAWHRQFRDSKPDAAGYFNPETINFQRLILSYRRGLAKGIRMSVKAGPGLQQVNNDSRTNTVYFEGGLEKNARSGLSFRLFYIYTDSFFDNSLLSYKISILSCGLSYPF